MAANTAQHNRLANEQSGYLLQHDKNEIELTNYIRPERGGGDTGMELCW